MNFPLPEWMQASLKKLYAKKNITDLDEKIILIKIDEQKLYLLHQQQIQQSYSVSTSRYGVGNKEGSYQTPLGTHKVAEKIGADCQLGEIIKARQATGKIAQIYTDLTKADTDLITTRILWLTGLEPGVNQGGEVDSHARYIYIHGTAEEGYIGQPASIGCVRMENQQVCELFQLIEKDTVVDLIV